MKLISMTDFVLEIENEIKKETYQIVAWQIKVTAIDRIFIYAQFLKQPLTLGMFIPCDNYGNVLKKPKWEDYNEETRGYYYAIINYFDAKSKVIFKDFEIAYTKEETPCQFLFNNDLCINVFLDKSFGVRHETIEDLVCLDLDCAVSF